ncbi:polysaccharide deacetylase family protein [Jeotgalibacillus proteolyticus]|nr:polysaccharide deacetylase family protein [Jeotgalibacillus proteolyticus]
MNNSKTTKRKCLAAAFIITLLFSIFLSTPQSIAEVKEEQAKIVVVYTSKENEINEYQRQLDMLLGHFSKDITFISSAEVEKKDLENATHLIYYGQKKSRLPETFPALLEEYTGPFLAIGYNTEQLGAHFDFIQSHGEIAIDQLYFTNDPNTLLNASYGKAIKVNIKGNTEILVEATKGYEDSIEPILVKNQNHYYFAIDDIALNETIFLGEILHTLFETGERSSSRPAYLRLEDVHPLVDPVPLQEIAEILKGKNIPYMIAVIPVYTSPQTGEKHYFSDSPALLKVLKQMQKDGASIVLHGYTHQYRSSETGEGFEFWDVENNLPVYASSDEEFNLKEKSEFKTAEEYEKYMDGLKQFEREYIQTKLTRGIQELVNYGLHPLAFEAPHYTMSQNGYQVVSDYFSTYVGQVQLSDEDWRTMDGTPYISTPSFLNGMELLPETLGFIEEDNPNSLKDIQSKSERIQMTENGIAAAFYHPYLGSEGLYDVLNEMERIPHLEWIDLKQRDISVQADNVSIYTINGEVIADVKNGALLMTSWDFSMYHIKGFLKTAIWGMAILGGVAVWLFVVFTIHLQTRSTKMEG